MKEKKIMERLISPTELAEMLGVKRITIYQRIWRKQLPVVKLGRLVRFRESDIRALIEDNYIPAGS